MVKGIWPKLWLVARTPVRVWNTAGGQSMFEQPAKVSAA